MFVFLLENEIFDRIFPHLQQECNAGYPFNSDKEIRAVCVNSEIADLPFAREIERDIRRMPKGYGLAFRYILYRELELGKEMSKARMKMFQMLARHRVDVKDCNPRFVARRAT